MKSVSGEYRLKVDETGIRERVARIKSRSLKGASKMDGLLLALSMLDLTTLEGADSPGKVKQLCGKGKLPDPEQPDLPSVAAICVYPSLVPIAKQALEGTDIKVASVATAFPSGQLPLSLRVEEVKKCVSDGADEIDMVISRGKYLSGDYAAIREEVTRVKEACGEAHLKVILETGELATLERVRHTSFLAMEAGADFIKTSTGKVNPAATMEVTLVMLEAIRDFYEQTGRLIGMKPAGGIRDSKTALSYLVMVKEILGRKWLSPEMFRIGASSLANDIVLQIRKQRRGVYQNPDTVTID